ncbi:glycoside hydrolase family 38 C-terminal domain-containing protein [Clostridium sp.]|uniref:glycoside hydrolase family 38 N-terminal domain-containing protein n=1 Tax=Clostridium sp. TaxID=1506 RepID=UPI003F38D11D
MNFLSKKLASLVMLTTMATSLVQPVTTMAYGKDKTVKMLGNAHIDAAWQWRVEETIRECETTFKRALDLMETNPDYKFSASSAQLYAWTEEYFPEIFERIKGQIDAGNWDVVGGQWVEPDLNVSSGEALVRQSLYGQNYFDENLGVKSTVGWVPDVFGFNYNMPQILSKSGMDNFITTKLNWQDTNKWPHEIFNWQSPDGSSVLAYKPKHDYVWNGGDLNNKNKYNELLDQPVSKGVDTAIALYGAGDHGGGPNQNDLNGIKNVNSMADAPNIEMTLAQEAFDSLRGDIESNPESNIPTVDNELYNEFHRGTYTTSGMIKKYNRMGEILAEEAEKFASLAYLLDGIEYPKEKIEQAWKIIALNQFHDILPGSSILGVYLDAFNDAEIALNLLNAVKEDALGSLASKVNTEGAGIPVVIFNPLSWDRNEYIEKDIVFEENVSDVEIKDSEGNIIESKVLSVDGRTATVLIKASVPATGYAVYRAESKENTYVVEDGVKADSENNTLENKFFKVTLNPETGNISSIIDKRNENKEVLEEGQEANELVILEDTPRNWEAWDVDKDDMNAEATKINGLTGIELIEDSSSKATFKVSREWGSSKFVSYVTLYSDEDRIDIKTDVEWNELRKVLKASFPLSVNPDKATFEIAYGSIERDTSWENRTTGGQFEVSGHKWADMTEGDYGVSILNDSKYGWDTLDNRIRLTLLKAAADNGGLTDRNKKHEINYSIYPHAGNWNEAETVKEAYNFNYAMDSVQTTSHEGELNNTKSFASSDSKNIIISAIKKAEKSDDIIVRLYEAEGKEGSSGTITLPSEIESIEEVNLIEDSLEGSTSPEVDGNKFTTTFKKHEIKTFKVKLKDLEGKRDTKVKSYPIDLASAYNLDGISTDSNRLDGDYTGTKESISAELLPDSISSEGIKYVFGPKADGQNNIVKAEGQTIDLPKEQHDALYLLGNAAGAGKADGKFIVNYTDGTSTEKYLSFVDWQEEVGQYMETFVHNTIGLRLTHTHKSGKNTLDIDNNMYVYQLKLDPSKVVDTIVLPDSSAIKVTAMSYADGVVQTSKDTEAPTKVEGFEVTTPFKQYSSYVDLKWNESSDNVGVKRYKVYRATKADMSDAKIIARTEDAEYRDLDVALPQRYYYYVKAEDASGNTGESSEIKAVLAGANIAVGKSVTVDGQMNDREAGPLAVDGNLNTKWCFNDGKDTAHWINIDLGEVTPFTGINIHHAGAGGENSSWNTRDYRILISNDNENWEVYEEVKGNVDDVTKHDKNAEARYVKLIVDKPTQGNDVAARIYEIEVLAEGNNDLVELPPQSSVTEFNFERGYSSLRMNFTPVEGAEYYKVLYGTTNNVDEMTVVDKVTNSYFDLTEVEKGKTYYFQVVPVNFYGEGPKSDIKEFKVELEGNIINDLSKYYNLDGMASGNGNKADGCFDGQAWLYDSDLIPDLLKVGDVEFKIGSKADGDSNVIKSVGQEIELNNVNATNVYLLGSAWSGPATGKFKVNYVDGTSVEKNITMSDWCATSKDNESEILALDMPHRLYNGRTNPDDANIQSIRTAMNMYHILLDSNKAVKSITLPNNEKMNIFAISTGSAIKDIVVSKPTNLKAETTKNEVKLTWNTPESKDSLKEYVVYKDGKECKTVPAGTNEITLNELRSNTIYGFKVTARYINNEESKPISINVRTSK